MVNYRVGLIAFATLIMRNNVEKVKHRPNGTNNPKVSLYIQHYQTSRTNRADLYFSLSEEEKDCGTSKEALFFLVLNSYYMKNSFILFPNYLG